MLTSLFDFHLPPERIAHTPVEPRDAARLLHVNGGFNDRHVRDLPQLLRPGDVMVLNNSKVIPARLFCDVGNKRVEVLLHRDCGEYWECFAKPARKLTTGMALSFGENFNAEVVGVWGRALAGCVAGFGMALTASSFRESCNTQFPKRSVPALNPRSVHFFLAQSKGDVPAAGCAVALPNTNKKTSVVKILYINFY